MHPIAYDAVAATIFTSALGAILLCLLVFRYGFEPAEEEVVEDRHRRYFVTRFDHAGGAVCFAMTAGLAAVALGLPAGTVADAPRADVSRADLTALRAVDTRIDASMRALAERLARAEASIAGVHAAEAARRRRDDRDPRARQGTTNERRPLPRASAPDPAPSPVVTPASSRIPTVEPQSRPFDEPGVSRVAVVGPPISAADSAAPPARPEASAVAAERPPVRAVTREADDGGIGVGQAVARVGTELGRTLARFTRDVRRFVEDLR